MSSHSHESAWNSIFCRFDIRLKTLNKFPTKTHTNSSTIICTYNIASQVFVLLSAMNNFAVFLCLCPFLCTQKKCDDAIKTAETKEWQAAHLFMCVHYIMQVKWTNCLFAHNILFRRGRRRRRRRLKKSNSMKILYTSCVYYVDLQIYEKWFDFLVERSTIKNLSGEKCVESPHTPIHTHRRSFICCWEAQRLK